jgi:hypothetical protein
MPLECGSVRARGSRQRQRETGVAKVAPVPEAGPGVEAVLELQRTLGNQAVSRLVEPLGRAPAGAIQRTKAEALGYVAEGAQWHADVWLGGGDSAPLVAKLNGELNQYEISFRRGFQKYDPVVVTGAPLTYQKIVDQAKGQADGGVAYARQFRDWYSGDTALNALPTPLRALALITHWAEVARGYKTALADLYIWIEEIADATSKEEARGLWGQFNARYRPSLMYKDDIRGEFSEDQEMEEARREEDEPYEEDDGSLIRDAGLRQTNILDYRLRSEKK